MKQLLAIFGTLLLVATLGVACDDVDSKPEPKIDQLPVNVSQDEDQKAFSGVTAFFETFSWYDEWPSPVGRGDGCVLINTPEEFRAFVPAEIELPTIDFGQYTLIVGRKWVSDGGFALRKHGIVYEQQIPVYTLVIERLTGPHHTALESIGYWGLYPKLSQTQMEVEVIFTGEPVPEFLN